MPTLDFRLGSGPLGAELVLRDAAALTDEPALRRLREMLDRRGVVRIAAEEAVPPEAISAIAHMLGSPTPFDGVRVKVVPGFDIISDLSGDAKHDDGRPRKLAAQELLHTDFAGGRPAAYSILHTRDVPPNDPMAFVDMRQVYADLPSSVRARIADLTSEAGWPLAAAHPRTGASLLCPPQRRARALSGLEEDAAAELIQALWELIETSPYRFEAEMRCNDLFVWDNLAAVHNNPLFPRDRDRVIWFLTIPLDEAAALRRPNALAA